MPEGHSFDFSDQDTSRVAVLEKGSLHRVLGTPQFYAIGYGDVGSSIFYALGVTTMYALGAAPIALALAGIVFFCIVLIYAELATAMPEAGGSCSFARYAFNDLIFFIAGWVLLLDYVVTLAISSYTVGPYLSYFFPGFQSGVAIGVILVLLCINFIGIRHSTWVSLVLCIRQPGLKRPFKAKLNMRFGKFEIPLTAVLGFLGTVAVWIDVIITKPSGRNFGFSWMVLGLASYFWYRHKQKLSPMVRLDIEKLKIPGYKPLEVKKILVPVANVPHSDTMQFAVNLAK